jgi:DNA-binding SARP family transcriptional activator
MPRPLPRPETPDRIHLRLLGSFTLLQDNKVVVVPVTVERLIIFLTFKARPLQRAYVAGTLWPDTTDERACANLRTALWKLNQLHCPLVRVTGSSLQIEPAVRVDLTEITASAYGLLNHGGQLKDLDLSQFCQDLLPDWYDDWIVFERQRFHQLRVRVLEVLCERLTAVGDYMRALDAGLAAVQAAPLHESAHRALIKVHLAESNRADAVMHFRSYRKMLKDELGIAPSSVMVEMVEA